MSGPDLMNDGLFFLICLLTVLLVMFIVQVIRTPLELARPADQPVLNLPEPPPPAPAAPAPPPALPARRPQVPAFPAAQPAMNGQSGNGGYSARHASAYQSMVSRPEVTGAPPWDPAPRPPDLDGRESLSAGHPASWPSLSVGHRASLPPGCSAGRARWHALVHGDPSPRHQPAAPDPLGHLRLGSGQWSSATTSRTASASCRT
jgi:hypothetical protein